MPALPATLEGDALEELAKDDIDQVGPLPGDFPAATAGIVPEGGGDAPPSLRKRLKIGSQSSPRLRVRSASLRRGFGENTFFVKWDHYDAPG